MQAYQTAMINRRIISQKTTPRHYFHSTVFIKRNADPPSGPVLYCGGIVGTAIRSQDEKLI